MSFFTDKSDYTHLARFYGVPCYLHIETMTLAGRNAAFDFLVPIAVWFHNAVIELVAQVWADVLGYDYEPGFRIKVWEMDGDEVEN